MTRYINKFDENKMTTSLMIKDKKLTIKYGKKLKN